MASIPVDTLNFDFPATWTVSKYDDWLFYRQSFCKTRDSVRSVDLIAVDPDKTAWFIEAKDYRLHARAKPSSVGQETAAKVFDTLAAMLPAKLNGRVPEEVETASAVLGAKKLRVVLHIEQPKISSALRPRAINLADVKQELRRLLRAIDAHPTVTEMHRMGSLDWTVT